MSERRPLRVLVVDDEMLARQRIEDLLRKEEEVEIAGTVDNGADAVDAIESLHPDLVFLDIQMPRMSGLEVVAGVGPERMPATIFVTAFDQHAIRAFELAALDYLVKPFDDARFEQAFRRAQKMIELEQVGKMTRELVSLLGGSVAPPQQEPVRAAIGYLERIAVETKGQIRVVPVEKIDYITASGPYAEIHVGEKSYAIRERMQTLEERLDPERFFRIHRSAIVRIDRVETLLRSGGGDYAVRLRGGAELSVSRQRKDELERRLGVSH
ncbi:MAG: LytTR family DNA-binding domain-containing protein [Thermoanaerobaculia bacterium]